MKTEAVTISKFKATCLGLLKQVRKKGEPILVTLRGEPIAMVVPPPVGEKATDWMGSFRNTGRIVGDIIGPAADPSEWEVFSR